MPGIEWKSTVIDNLLYMLAIFGVKDVLTDSCEVSNVWNELNTYSTNIAPLTCKSVKHLISPYNITPKSHIKVIQ